MEKKKEVEVVHKGIVNPIMSAFSHHDTDAGKADISVLKLINYNLLFFIPIMIFMLFALKIGSVYSDYFEVSPGTVAKILMVPFMFLLFLFIVPFIREREKLVGIRYSIVAFLVIGVGITLPSVIKGDYGLLMTIINYFGSYILVTFIMCPEVLGIERNLRDWFKHRKQILIIAIFISIVLLYVVGFGALYYDVFNDPRSVESFTFSIKKEPTLATFVYYSMVTFSTTGYGDIIPASTAARLVFFMESLYSIIINVLFVAILLMFVGNAEFMTQKSEEAMAKVVKKEELEIEKEEKEIKEVERAVKRKLNKY